MAPESIGPSGNAGSSLYISWKSHFSPVSEVTRIRPDCCLATATGCDLPLHWKRQGDLSTRVLLNFTPFDLLEPESRTIIDHEVNDPWFGSIQRLVRLTVSTRYTFG
jgi:hypothetical protein